MSPIVRVSIFRFPIDKLVELSSIKPLKLRDAVASRRKNSWSKKSWFMIGLICILLFRWTKCVWHKADGHKGPCYKRTTDGTFVLNLLYSTLFFFIYLAKKCWHFWYYCSLFTINSCRRSFATCDGQCRSTCNNNNENLFLQRIFSTWKALQQQLKLTKTNALYHSFAKIVVKLSF